MKLSTTVVVALGFALLGVKSAAACSCQERSLHDRIEAAERIVLARVTSSTYSPESGLLRQLRVTYEVIETLKGDAEPRAGIAHEPKWGPGNCSLPLFPGHQFLLFLSGKAPVGSCSGSFMYVPGNIPSEEALARVREALHDSSVSGSPLERSEADGAARPD